MSDFLIDRLDAMRAGKTAIKVIPFPGLPEDEPPLLLGLRPLTPTELRDCGVRAAHKVKELPEHLGLVSVVKDAYDVELSLQMLHLVLLDPKTREPFAQSVDDLRDKLSLPEMEFIVKHALEWQEFVSPDLNNPKVQDELLKMVDELGKGGPSATPSDGKPRGEIRKAFSGGRQTTSPTDSSSGSSSAESSPTATPGRKAPRQ